jgi:hypothetical protein
MIEIYDEVCSKDDMGNSYNILVEITRKRPFGRPIREYMDNIKIGYRPIMGEDIGKIELAQNWVQI